MSKIPTKLLLRVEFNRESSAPMYRPSFWNDLPTDPNENVNGFFEEMRTKFYSIMTTLQLANLLSLGNIVSLAQKPQDHPMSPNSRIRRLLLPEDIEKLVFLINCYFAWQQTRANCYAYALDYRDGPPGAKPDPGGKTIEYKHGCYNTYRDAITEGACEDGLILVGKDLPPLREDYYRVALLVRESLDKPSFHWVRKDGYTPFWSHKDGHGQTKRVDYSGKLITDPKTAFFGDYKFSDYFYVKPCTVPAFLNAANE